MPPERPRWPHGPGVVSLFTTRLAAVDPSARTRDLRDALTDVAYATVFLFVCGWVPFATLLACGYLAMGLKDCAATADRRSRAWLRSAALIAVVLGVLFTWRLWADGVWIDVSATLVMGLLGVCVTAGFGGFAAEFGGMVRWARARSAAVVMACACCFLAGLLAAGPPIGERISMTIQLPDGALPVIALAVVGIGWLYVATAFSGLRSRVAEVADHLQAEVADHVHG